MPLDANRKLICDVARTWLRTPFHDCAKVKGAGVDCGQFLAAVFEEAALEAPVKIEPYSPQWYLNKGVEFFLEYITSRAFEIQQRDALPGDVVIYKFGRAFSHAAIIIEPRWPRIIHAYRQERMVTMGQGDQGFLAERERKFYRHNSFPAPAVGEFGG